MHSERQGQTVPAAKRQDATNRGQFDEPFDAQRKRPPKREASTAQFLTAK
jgi:hypothetical protein